MHAFSPFYILHLLSLFILVGVWFAAIAHPTAETRKKMLMYSGIASLGVMLTGFGMLGMMHMGWPGWAVVKIVCWLLLSALLGQVFRKPEQARSFAGLVILLVAVALVMVYTKPF